MRIIHFADLHLGVENYGRLDPQTGLSSRLGDFLRAFDRLVDYALEQNVDLVLFCGDAYKSREPSQTHQREFARRIWRLASSDIPVFLLTGNHDLPNAVGRATSTEIFQTLAIPKVTVANRPGTYVVDTGAGPLQVVAIPWARKSVLLSREDTKDLTLDEVNHRMEQVITERIQNEAAGLDPKLPALLTAHLFVQGAQTGSERGMIMGHDYMLLHSSVANPAFNYVALGHIHKAQVLGGNPPVVYAGSLERIDFSEENDTKGFYVVDLGEDRGLSYEFQPVDARRFLTIRVKVAPLEPDPTQAVLDAIASNDVKDAIVRVQVAIPERLEELLDEGEIRRALKDAHSIAAIARDVERERRPRLAALTAEGMTAIEALEVYLTSKGVPEDRMKVLLEYGQRLIEESEGRAT
ncbi:MAG: metallophosphoesterase family protein [Chloroflexota bacterium]